MVHIVGVCHTLRSRVAVRTVARTLRDRRFFRCQLKVEKVEERLSCDLILQYWDFGHGVMKIFYP